MNAFFYSDPHFGHKNICELANRPFSSVEEMNTTLVERYRRVVNDGDIVYWLGDCFLCSMKHAWEMLSELPGYHLLILGNHDRNKTAMLRIGFHAVLSEPVFVQICGRRCRLSHYPYIDDSTAECRYPERRPTRVKGEILIHGHTHSRNQRKDNMIHVGVDAWDFYPVPFGCIHELIRCPSMERI